jgi:hypothetical protein
VTALGWVFLALGVCLTLALWRYGYWCGKAAGNRERCDRHSHAERVAVGREEAPQHDGPPARVTTADFRNTRIEEGWDEERDGPS